MNALDRGRHNYGKLRMKNTSISESIIKAGLMLLALVLALAVLLPRAEAAQHCGHAPYPAIGLCGALKPHDQRSAVRLCASWQQYLGTTVWVPNANKPKPVQMHL